MPTRKRETAFTLIELSIVLVIIGLVVGGVMVGRDLIEAARIRQMGSEINNLTSAITTFKLKYNCLPGDCADATAYFGVNSGGCPDGGGATGTCNGNGDGFVNAFNSAGNIEHIYAWQQLSLANLVPWSLTANASGGANWTPLLVGQNIPASKFNPAIGYNFYSVRMGATTAYIKTIEIGAQSASTNLDVLCGAGLTAPQAQSLDAKFDDGLPQRGKIFAVSGGSSISAYNTIDTKASVINSNINCVSGGVYLTSANSGCTMESRVDVP